MTFEEIVDQAIEMVRRRGQVSYRMIKRQFDLEDDVLDDLKEEILYAQRQVVDDEGKGLVWIGETAAAPVTTSQPVQPTPQPVVEQPQPAHVEAPPVEPRTPDAERRQLTVMFCDLVDSTALSGRLDPEDLREVIQAYQAACTEVIQRYDGHVAQLLGDGLLVYFGYPQAHEDDAQRAVRAGLGILDAMGPLNTRLEQDHDIRLAVRIGIHTGPVVVGEIGGSTRQEQLALGETPNIAARLQGMAQPDTVVISAATQRLARGVFELDDLGTHALKGVAEPTHVYGVRGERAVASRFEAAAAGNMTPFVGRESEVALLVERWEQAKESEGQVVLLCGEPGIGKSRITQFVHERLAGDPHTRLRYQCSPYYTNSAFYPVIAQLERATGFEHDDTPAAKLDKLEVTLGHGTDKVAQVAPLIAAMMSLPLDRYPALRLSPQKQKELTIEALADQVIGLSRRQPLLMVFEDAHWADPTTLETLAAVIDRLQDASILLLITFRPEFEPPWSGYGRLTTITLNRLSRRHGQAMVERVTGGKPLPDVVLDQILAKADGVPLFVEELTKTVLEAGCLKDADDHYALDGPLPPLAIPMTLQDSLLARLDRHGAVKEIAQIGACIGREFDYELLAAVSPLRDDDLRDALRQLVQSELAFERGAPPTATYLFKHALVQDAAYATLLKSRRQHVHASIAQQLEERFSHRVQHEPELAALHFERAHNFPKAAVYWLAAGRRNLEASAVTEAIAHLECALSVNDQCAASAERDRRDIAIRLALGNGYITAHGWPTIHLQETLEPALELCMRDDDADQALPILYQLWMYAFQRCAYGEAHRLENVLEELGATHHRSDMGIVAHTCRSMSRILSGDFTDSREHSDTVMREYRSAAHASLVHVMANDPFTLAGTWSELAHWVLGWPERARQVGRRQLASARTLGHPFNLCWALIGGAWSFIGCRDAREANAWIDEAVTLAQAHGFAFMEHCMCRLWSGMAHVAGGDYEQGYAKIEPGLALWRQSGGQIFVPWFNTSLAEAVLRLGDKDRALALIAEALDRGHQHAHPTFEAEAHRVHGLILSAAPHSNVTEAEAAFKQGVATARRQQAKSWELRAATSLASLWQSQGKRQEAYDLLAPVYNWFTEGFDTADLIDAKTLLDDLAT